MDTKLVLDLLRQARDMGWNGPVHFSHYSEPLLDPRFLSFVDAAIKYGLKPELYTNANYLTDELIKKIDGVIPRITFSFRTPGTQEYWQSKFKKSQVYTCESYHVLIWNKNKPLLETAINDARGTPCVGPLFTAFRINYDGQMSMCYADFNNEFGLLNAKDHPLEELWFGSEHVNAVKEMSKPGSRENRALCRVCPRVYPDGGYYVPVESKKVNKHT
jgi:MoaA/NifB/PqqE/SkfB family radical SAM enzyme